MEKLSFIVIRTYTSVTKNKKFLLVVRALALILSNPAGIAALTTERLAQRTKVLTTNLK
jgi:hypothetical protein